jgi:hypothetical protein
MDSIFGHVYNLIALTVNNAMHGVAVCMPVCVPDSKVQKEHEPLLVGVVQEMKK